MKLNEALAKIDSWNVLVLLVLSYLLMVSGYMITKGLFSRYWGIFFHNNFDLLIAAAFSIHFAIRLRFFLTRRKLANGYILSLITCLVGLLPFCLIIYLEFFFQMA